MRRLYFLTRLDVILGTVATLILVSGAWFQFLPLSLTEVLGFVSGAITVWLTVKENIWNWPIGIANNIFFVILFFSAQLYADMGLQLVYIVLGFLGWYWWLHGGANKMALPVSRTSRLTGVMLATLVALATAGMTLFLQEVGDSAPFWDALTTMLSLAAQYMLTKKLVENWYVWITADIIYIGLYAYKNLYLTSALYVIFLCMCVAGLLQWRKSLAQPPRETPRVLEQVMER